LKAALSSSAVMGFSAMKVRSTMETLGVGTRMAKPSSLPEHLGDDQLEGLGGAGRGGNHGEGGGAGAAQVLVRRVQDDLVVGVAVDGGHDAADDAAGLQLRP
jgi:hypothetical protein